MSQDKVKTLGFASYPLRIFDMSHAALIENDRALNQPQSRVNAQYNNFDTELKKRVQINEEDFRNNGRLPITIHVNPQLTKKTKNCLPVEEAYTPEPSYAQDTHILTGKVDWNAGKEQRGFKSEIHRNRDCGEITLNPLEFEYGHEKDFSIYDGRKSFACAKNELAPLVTSGPQTGAKHRMEVFSELSLILKKLFLGKLSCNEDIILSCEEMMVLSTIMIKKFDYEPPVANIYKVLHLFNENLYRAKKRAEECYKFIFKHAYKNLKRAYNDLQLEKQLSDNQPVSAQDFYNYYFGAVSRSQNIPLAHFYLPLTPDSYCNKNDKLAPKTINMGYAQLISKSGHFMHDFLIYLNDKFINDYCQLINLKIDHMAVKWTEISISYNHSEKSIFFICDYIRTNKKCKLPWTVAEVKTAIEITTKMIERSNVVQKLESANSESRASA